MSPKWPPTHPHHLFLFIFLHQSRLKHKSVKINISLVKNSEKMYSLQDTKKTFFSTVSYVYISGFVLLLLLLLLLLSALSVEWSVFLHWGVELHESISCKQRHILKLVKAAWNARRKKNAFWLWLCSTLPMDIKQEIIIPLCAAPYSSVCLYTWFL